MPDVLIRNLDAKTVKRLKERAKRNGRSLQSEAKMVLEQAADAESPEINHVLEIARKWRKRFAGRKFSDSVELIREGRER